MARCYGGFIPSKDDNDLLCRTVRARPWANLFRRFWLPALIPSELPTLDSDPIRFRILGEDLFAFATPTAR
jgi:phthalate 4,5-dioxygenase